eukprot:1194934-Prorocentrum_minimum.AAC.1
MAGGGAIWRPTPPTVIARPVSIPALTTKGGDVPHPSVSDSRVFPLCALGHLGSLRYDEAVARLLDRVPKGLGALLALHALGGRLLGRLLGTLRGHGRRVLLFLVPPCRGEVRL